jgi:hypothetical protein
MSIANMRIMIAPVGFEVDRVVVPAIQNRVDKVFLIMHNNKSGDKAASFFKRIVDELKKNNIKSEEVQADRNNLFELIKIVRKIIDDSRKSEFLINVSSGSKIQAVACMMAIMIFDDRTNLKPFYVEPEKYNEEYKKKNIQQSYGIKNIYELPTYQIKTPDYKLLKALEIIKEYTNKPNYKGRINKKELARILEEREVIKIGGITEPGESVPKNHKNSKYSTLDKQIVQPLKSTDSKGWGFITEEKIGRSRYISFTEEGRNASEFLF